MTEITETGMTKKAKKVLDAVDSFISAYKRNKADALPPKISLTVDDYDTLVGHYKFKPEKITRRAVILVRT